MYNRRRAKFLIEQELSLFPQATLADIYKLFFQNCRGSGHFSADLAIIKDRINQELQNIDVEKFHYPDYDISYLFKIKRISILSILKGKYDLNFIADKFLELAIMPCSLSLDDWTKEWKAIKRLTLKIHPEIVIDILDPDLDLNQSLHHSEIYRENYSPHYRICNL